MSVSQLPHGSNWVTNMTDSYVRKNVKAISGKHHKNIEESRANIRNAPQKDFINHVRKNKPEYKATATGEFRHLKHEGMLNNAKEHVFEERMNKSKVKGTLFNEPKSSAQRANIAKARKTVKGASGAGRLTGLITQGVVFLGLPSEYVTPAFAGLMVGEGIYLVGDMIFKGIEIAFDAMSLGTGTPIILILEAVQALGAILAGMVGAIGGILVYESFVLFKYYIYGPHIKPYFEKTKKARKNG